MTQKNNKLRIGIVGAGNIVRTRHLPALKKNCRPKTALAPPHAIRRHSFKGVYLNPEAPAHGRQKIEISGLNVLTLGIYVEVLQRWLGDIVGVFAREKILTAERRGYRVIVPDMLNVLCVFESGAEGVLEVSGVHAGAPNDRLRIFGDRGALLYDFTDERVRSVKYGGREMEDVDGPKELTTELRVGNDFIFAGGKKRAIENRPRV